MQTKWGSPFDNESLQELAFGVNGILMLLFHFIFLFVSATNTKISIEWNVKGIVAVFTQNIMRR